LGPYFITILYYYKNIFLGKLIWFGIGCNP
jgi:hypothetical protein